VNEGPPKAINDKHKWKQTDKRTWLKKKNGEGEKTEWKNAGAERGKKK